MKNVLKGAPNGKLIRFNALPLNCSPSLVPWFICPAEGSAGVPRSELHRSPPQSTADHSGCSSFTAVALLRLVRLVHLQSVCNGFVRC